MPEKKKVKIKTDAPGVMDKLQPVAETTGGPVIQFVGKRKVFNKETGLEETITREAPTRRRNGARVIELPGTTIQKSGFTHPDAEFLLTAYPKDFKRKKNKGEK